MAATLTVANSAITMTIEAVAPQPVRLTGYAADNVFETDAVENVEFVMGVDGKMSRGYVHNPVRFTLTLQADSDGLDRFEDAYQYSQANRESPEVNITVTLPSTGKRYKLINGGIQSYKAPSAQRILQAGVVTFMFERMEISRI